MSAGDRGEPPLLEGDDALLAALAEARGADVVGVVGTRLRDVLVRREYLEPNAWNDADPEWRFTLTTALAEVAWRDDDVGVDALLEAGALVTRYVTNPDGSTGGWRTATRELRTEPWLPRTCPLPLRAAPRDPPPPPPYDGAPPVTGAAAARWLAHHQGVEGQRVSGALRRRLWRAAHAEVARARAGELDGEDRARALVCGLLAAFADSDDASLRALLAAGADPTRAGPGAVTAIGAAVRTDDVAALAVFLDASPAGLEAPCAWRFADSDEFPPLAPIRPLHLAAAESEAATVAFLLERGADPTAGFPGLFPLGVACARSRPVRHLLGHAAAPRLLARHGAEELRARLDACWPARPARDWLLGSGWLPGASPGARVLWWLRP